jgi:hypothetical protein
VSRTAQTGDGHGEDVVGDYADYGCQPGQFANEAFLHRRELRLVSLDIKAWGL